MKRIWLAVVLACGLPVAAWGAQPAQAGGVYVVDFQVRLGRALPVGSLVTCKVTILPETRGQVQQTVMGTAPVQGSSAHCAVKIPAAWGMTATLSYEIDAGEPTGAGVLLRTVAGTAPRLPTPPAGGEARLDLNLTL
ncbi:MAG: hypothetical protein P4L40_20935 [Terracidiphilus sp.]|nr:hypothetical protein [Terracidiphilus sp.]